MANDLLTIDMITREAIRLWKNTNAFLQEIDNQYDDQFAQTGAKIGDSLRIRLPNDYTVRHGPAAQVQDTTEQSTTLTLATQAGVDVSFNSKDRSLSLDDYSERVLAPAVNNLAGDIAADIMTGSEGGVAHIVANLDANNAIIAPTSLQYLDAGATLDINSAPKGRRKVVNDPRTQARIVNSLSGLFNPSTVISKQFSTGEMYNALGLTWMSDQTVLIHTDGTLAQSSATVNGAGQTGLALTVDALAGSLFQGDIVTIDGVYMVNRITKDTTGELMQFVVTEDSLAGATEIAIYPALIPAVGGQKVQYQTVTASPADGAAVNPALGLGASAQYRKNIVFTPEAITMATADMEIPRGVHEAYRETFDGISMRMITAYDVMSDQFITRLDVLYGFLWIRPEWCVIVADAVSSN